MSAPQNTIRKSSYVENTAAKINSTNKYVKIVLLTMKLDQKITLFFLFAIAVIFFSGCPYRPDTTVCGDNVCEGQEQRTCPADCGSQPSPRPQPNPGPDPQPKCTDECKAGATQCSGEGYKACGNFDDDQCTEWGSVQNCKAGEICENGGCVIFPIVEMQLQTEKSLYGVGEQVRLSGSKKSKANFSEQTKTLSEINLQDVFNSYEEPLSNTDLRVNSIIELEKEKRQTSFKGYIVELEDPPLAVKRREFEELGQDATYIRVYGQAHQQKLGYAQQAALMSLKEKIPALKVRKQFTTVLNAISLDISDKEAEELRKLPFVKNVTPNYLAEATTADSIPLVKADYVWKLDEDFGQCSETKKDCLTGAGIKIGVIDTGVDYTNPDFGSCTKLTFLAGQCSKVVGGYDFVNNDADPMDDDGHGTHVAGIITANSSVSGNEFRGVAPESVIYAYKVLGPEGKGYIDGIIDAIDWSADPNQDGDFSDHLDVINLSLGFIGNPDNRLVDAVDNAVSVGVIAVVAAGNEGPYAGTIRSPGIARSAITVGATYKKNYDGKYWKDDNPRIDEITSFSSRGPVSFNNEIINKPDIVAPGALICSSRWDSLDLTTKNKRYTTCIDDKHIFMAGTSMAAPMVSGAAALMKQAHPEWSSLEMKMALRAGSEKIVDRTNSDYPLYVQGFGRLNLQKSITMEKPPIAILNKKIVLTGIIDILGTATGSSFEKYEIYYGKSITPKEWTLLFSSTSPVSNGVLYRGFDTSTLGDMTYALKLVVHAGGIRNEDMAFIRIENVEITTPLNNDVLRAGDTVTIKGLITVTDFDSYSLEYSKDFEAGDTKWSSQGITITNGIQNSVLERELGKWNTSNLPPGFYTLKLAIKKGSVEKAKSFAHKIYLDNALEKGWPKHFPERGELSNQFYSIIPHVVDLENDGFKEILFVDSSGNGDTPPKKPILFAYNYDGTLRFSIEDTLDTFTEPAIVTSDIDNDGLQEIFVSGTKIYAFNHDGSSLNGKWPATLESSIATKLMISDLDRDGEKEIISYTFGGSSTSKRPSYYILNGEGEFLTIIRAEVIESISEPEFSCSSWVNLDQAGGEQNTIGNFDDDEELEIAVQLCNGVSVYNKDGSVVQGWPKRTGAEIDASIISGDMDADGVDEIVAPTKKGIEVLGTKPTVIGWPPQEIAKKRFSNGAALADFDKDGFLEIVAIANNNEIFVFSNDGKILNGWPKNMGIYLTTFSSPNIVDIDNDGTLDVLITDGAIQPSLLQCGNTDGSGGVWAWSYDGIPIDLNPNYDLYSNFIEHATTAPSVIDDIDNDGALEIITSSKSNFAFCPLPYQINKPCKNPTIDETCRAKLKKRSTVYVWNTGAKAGTKGQWQQFQNDPEHTGNYRTVDSTKSEIKNESDKNLNGKLTLKIEMLAGQGWLVETFVSGGEPITIAPNSAFDLAEKFDSSGGYKAQKLGKFRVIAEFEYSGKRASAASEFEVK